MALAKKAKRPLWARGVRLGFALVVSALILGGVFYGIHRGIDRVRSAPLFALQSVDLQITPELHVAGYPVPSQLIAEANVHNGESLLRLDLVAVQKRLEALPWVREAHVSRRFPNRLLLQVYVYEPRAILSTGKLYYVNDQGKIFKEVRGPDHKDFPLITGLAEGDFNERPEVARQAVQQALALLEALQNSGLSALLPSRLSEVHLAANASEQWELSVFLAGTGTEIRLGAPPYDENLKRLAAVQKHTHGQIFRAGIVDLRFKDRLVATPKNNDVAGRGIEFL